MSYWIIRVKERKMKRFKPVSDKLNTVAFLKDAFQTPCIDRAMYVATRLKNKNTCSEIAITIVENNKMGESWIWKK